MIKFYLDCEFDGFGGKLLSMALVPESDYKKPFYYVIKDNVANITQEWVKQNVLPYFDEPSIDTIYGNQIDLPKAIQSYITTGWDDIVIIADWADDIKYFCESMMTGAGFVIKTPEITFKLVHADAYPTSLSNAVRHNAYWDAMALRQYFIDLYKN